MKRCLLNCGIKSPLHTNFRREIKHTKFISPISSFFRSIGRKKLVSFKRYVVNTADCLEPFFLFLQSKALFKGFNPTNVSNIFDYYGLIKKEYGLTNLDRALDIQGEIYLLSNQEKDRIKNLLEINFRNTEKGEREKYHLNNWLNNDYITVIKVKGEDRSECYISWYDFDNLSKLSKLYVSSYISNNSLPSLEANKNRVHYENFLIKIFSKIRENQVDPLNEMTRYLMYQSVKGVIDLAPYVLRKTLLKKSILKEPGFSGDDFCKDILLWEYCPPKYRRSTGETRQSDLTSWETTDCDRFLLKQILNSIFKVPPLVEW